MAQQINLYSPILLKPKRLFSALAIAQALVLFLVVLIAVCVWVSGRTKAYQAEMVTVEKRYTEERERLQIAIASRPTPTSADISSLEQNLKAMQQSLQLQRASLSEMNLGRWSDGRSYSAVLRLIAQTVPGPVWVTEIKMAIGRIEITGMALDPAALQAWAARLSRHSVLAGQRLAAVKVERAIWRVPGAATAAPALGGRPPETEREAWAYTLVSDSAPPTPTPAPNAVASPGGLVAAPASAASGAL